MTIKGPAVIIFLGLMLGHGSGREVQVADSSWWKNAVIYQIYPKSFQSSTGKGTGDLKGVLARLPYVKQLGVDAVWLNPFYLSLSKADSGYDISDYQSVDPDFGTMEDFKLLLETCHNSSLRVILDFVPNHSSDKHEWFEKSVKREEPYTDYYVWSDPGPTEIQSDYPKPPNNWMSVVSGPAWKYNEQRKQFYLHQFLEQQPDLNYGNPKVLDEMEKVLRFWLELGIDGIRVDAAFALTEDSYFRDEPPLLPGTPVTDYSSLRHIYTADQPETFNVLGKFRQILDEYTKRDGLERVMITESYTSDLNTFMKYYGTKDLPIAHFPFNFEFLLKMKSHHIGKDWADTINSWFQLLPMGEYWPNWVMGNHDFNRLSSRFSPELTDVVNMVLMSLPGTFFCYYGDELALEDSFVRPDQARDPQGILAPPDQFYLRTRDPERGPMPWNDTLNGGFSVEAPWLPITSDSSVNVQRQMAADKSHLKLFKSLVQMRKLYTFSKGDFLASAYSENTPEILIITRTLVDHPTVLTVANFGNYRAEVYLQKYRDTLPGKLYVYVSSTNSPYKPRQILSIDPLVLEPASSLVLSTATLD